MNYLIPVETYITFYCDNNQNYNISKLPHSWLNRGYLIFPCLAEPIKNNNKTNRTDAFVGIRTSYVLSNKLRFSGRFHKQKRAQVHVSGILSLS